MDRLENRFNFPFGASFCNLKVASRRKPAMQINTFTTSKALNFYHNKLHENYIPIAHSILRLKKLQYVENRITLKLDVIICFFKLGRLKLHNLQKGPFVPGFIQPAQF